MWCVNFVGALLCTQEERGSSYTNSFCENIDHFDCHTGTVSAYKFWCCLTGVEEGELCGTLYIAHTHVCVQWSFSLVSPLNGLSALFLRYCVVPSSAVQVSQLWLSWAQELGVFRTEECCVQYHLHTLWWWWSHSLRLQD